MLRVIGMSGPLLIDEALSVARGILNANPNAILFTLLPMAHSSTESQAVTKNRRALEDRILAFLFLNYF